ncbi:MAG TPA: hypothetical protein VMW47_07810 [Verrucomicrobiae bacterium]|nr:hypothetical protein [Verrucomicrobiae bacterium]
MGASGWSSGAGIRIIEGLDPEDRIAFGLTAPRLLVAVGGVVLAMACAGSPLAAVLRAPLAALLVLVTAALAWGRLGGRPALDWAPLVAGYALRRWRARPQPEPPRERLGRGALGAAGPPSGRAGPLRGSAPGPALAPPFLGGTRRIVFFSLRGGVGRTTLAIEVASLLARDGRVCGRGARPRPLRVALVDLDIEAGQVAERIGCTGPSLADLLGQERPGPAAVRQALVRPAGSPLRALLAPPQAPSDRDGRLVERIVTVLYALDGSGVEAALVDIGPGLDPLAQRILAAAHDVVLVLADTPGAAHDVVRARDALRPLRLAARIHVVHNRAHTVGAGDRRSGQLTARVLSDPRFERAQRTRIPAVLDRTLPLPEGLAVLTDALLPAVRRDRHGEPATAR